MPRGVNFGTTRVRFVAGPVAGRRAEYAGATPDLPSRVSFERGLWVYALTGPDVYTYRPDLSLGEEIAVREAKAAHAAKQLTEKGH